MAERTILWAKSAHALEQLRKIHSGERDMCILCYRGEDCSYRYLISVVDELKIEEGVVEKGVVDVDKVRLIPAGSVARVWRCRNCGDGHGGEHGCADPDFHRLTLYTIEGE